MSRDLKRMRRKAMVEMARTNRKQTQGGGALRRTVAGWVWDQKRTLYDLYRQEQQEQGRESFECLVAEAMTPC